MSSRCDSEATNMTFAGPLEGLRVIELGYNSSSSYGARLLADLGAEVIKIEHPQSTDPLRLEPPFVSETGESALFSYLNYGKRSVSLDVSSETGNKLLMKMLALADVVICATDTRSKTPEPFNIDDLDPLTRPVVLWVSPHGRLGVRSDQPSSPFVLQYASGFAFHQATPVSDPENIPPTAGADREGALAIGLVVANAALWALSTIEQGKPKPRIDLSAEDVYAYLLIEPFADWEEGIASRQRQSDPNKPTMVAGGLVWLLHCADGAIMVSPREDHQWERWLEVMGHPQWSKDPVLCGDKHIRAEHAKEIGKKMTEWSMHQKCQDVFAMAQAQRVACFPISTAKDLIDNEQLAHRQFYSKLQLTLDRNIPVAGLSFKMRTSTGKDMVRGVNVTAPALGEANLDMLGA